MEVKNLLIAHGEKALALAVVGLCAWEISSTVGDASIRPANDPGKLEEMARSIDQALRAGGAPQFKAVPPYLDDLQKRMAGTVQSQPAMPWLTAMPDRGPNDQTLLYVYELPAPAVQGRDFSGEVQLTVALPRPVRPADRRVSDAPSTSWKTPAGLVNTARVVGVLVEARPGPDRPWEPVKAPGVVNGFLPLSAGSGAGDGAEVPAGGPTVRLRGLEPWTRYEFRASLVAAATGPVPGKGVTKGGHGVLVVGGRVAGPDAGADSLPWDEWLKGLERNDPAVTGRFLPPRKGVLPAGTALAAGEQVYVGAPTSAPAVVPVTSDVRFGFERITTVNGQPAAQVLITKQFTVGGSTAWLKDPVVFRAAKGERLGGPAVIPDPRSSGAMRINVDFSTPFEVAEIRTGIPRIYYHEIREVPRSDGKRGRELQAVSRTATTDVVVLRNVRTGSLFELVRLAKIPAGNRPGVLVTPSAPAEVDERAVFLSDPAGFSTTVLEPPRPRRWEADQGPLADLRAKHPDYKDYYSTEVAYFELPDGRITWYDSLNRKVHVYPEATPAAEAAPAADAPAAAKPK